MTDRRQPPRLHRHRALLRLAAGAAMSLAVALPAMPALAQATQTPTATPETHAERDRAADGSRPAREAGRRTRDDRAPRAEPTAILAPSGRSVRPRGAAAPVSLGPTATPSARVFLPETGPIAGLAPTPTPDAPRAAGQAPLNQPLGSERRYAVPKKPEIDTGLRVWPMREGDYSFSQEYGCVEQISGFYPAAEGCPADRPVIHSGLDFAADTGTLIYAAASGWVTEAGLDRETGLANTRIVIQHEGQNRDYATEYLHWIAAMVRPGDYVRAGEPIAEVGSVGYSTGPHLHFAVIDFRTGGYLDPREWLPDATDEGDYREERRERARTRYADRSAGVPDYHDPAPAPAPTRQPVPEQGSATGQAGAGQSREDRKRERRERRAERRERLRTTAAAAAGDASAEDSARPPREDRVRRDRSGETAAGGDTAGPTPTDPTRKRDADRKRDGRGERDTRPSDRERDDRNRNGGSGKDRERSASDAAAENVAGVPDAPITGGLEDGSAVQETPTATPEPPADDPGARRGRAR